MVSSSSSMKETKRRGRDRTAEVDVVDVPTGVEELMEALVKLLWELIPDSKPVNWCIQGHRVENALG